MENINTNETSGSTTITGDLNIGDGPWSLTDFTTTTPSVNYCHTYQEKEYKAYIQDRKTGLFYSSSETTSQELSSIRAGKMTIVTSRTIEFTKYLSDATPIKVRGHHWPTQEQVLEGAGLAKLNPETLDVVIVCEKNVNDGCLTWTTDYPYTLCDTAYSATADDSVTTTLTSVTSE